MGTLKYEFIYGFLDIDAYEMPLKGYRNDIVVTDLKGNKHNLCFYDPVRLAQDIEQEEIIIEKGLIVVKEVNTINIEKAINKMHEEGFFDAP